MSTGFLVPEDELFVHQVADTFASVGQSDRSWTEKMWGTVYAPDGSLQISFGLGLYPNRGVVDCFAGASRGREQWTVRASRALDRDGAPAAGPFSYRVVDPLRSVEIALAPQEVLPVSFSVTLTGVVPPALEERELKRSSDGRRIDSDIVRFHHICTAVGWIELEGQRYQVDGWAAARDRSWGVRYMIGAPPTDIPYGRRPKGGGSLTVWAPFLCQTAEGSGYGVHVYYHSEHRPGLDRTEAQGGIEYPDGTGEPFMGIRPELTFDPVTRRLTGGTLHATMPDGSARPLTVAALGDTGFHLGTGLYFGFDGGWHGQYKGPLEVAGEHLPDCTDPEVARRIHQIRDCVVSITDPVGGGRGVGTMQTIAIGVHPGTDLTSEKGFL